jgi:MSHA pilin protein MshD
VLSRRSREQAVTLVEALLASAVIAFAVVAVSQAVIAGQMQTVGALHHRRALELADAMMDEILHLPYEDPGGASAPGPEAGETTRAAFDNADDYHGWSEAAGSLADATGTAYPTEFQDFSRAVTAAYQNITVAGLSGPLPGLTITVTVQDTAGATWTTTRFIAQPPS